MKRANPSIPTWERNAKLRDDTYDQDGYHGERDTTLVAPGSNPLKRQTLSDAADLFTIFFLQSLKTNFAGNVARWTQVPLSTRAGSTTAFEVENRRPGYGAMLALAPTITYRQKTVTYSIGQWRMSLPFDQFSVEYSDPQTLALLAMGMRQIYNIFDAEMNNSVLSALRVAYMNQFDNPIGWLEETLQYAGLLNEKSFTGNELVSLYKNIQPNQSMRLLLATSESAFTAMNLPPVTPNSAVEPLDPSNLLSIMTRSLQASGSKRQVNNLDIYGIPHYTDEHNANILQTADSIDANYPIYGVIMHKSVPEDTTHILIPSLSGLWYTKTLTSNKDSEEIWITKQPIKIRGSDLMTGPLMADKPLFDGKYHATRSIQNFDQETGSANILTSTGWGGAVTLPDQVSIGGAAYILSVDVPSKKTFVKAKIQGLKDDLTFDEKRYSLFNLSADNVETDDASLKSEFQNARNRIAEWKMMFENQSVRTGLNYGAGALLPFIAVSTGSRSWVPGHPMFERLAICPHTSRINNTINKEIPTHNEFIVGINTIGHVATVN